MIMIKSAISQIERSSTDVTTPIVHGKQEPTGKTGEPWVGAEPGVQSRHTSSDVRGSATDTGQRRCHDVSDALVSIGRQKPCVAHCMDEVGWQRIWQAAKLQAGA
jgi:hypothetical protein